MNEIQTIFVRKFKRLLNEAGMTQAAQAEKYALSTYYVIKIETGRRFPSVDSLEKLCQALNVRPYRLFISEEDGLESLDMVRHELLLGRLKKSIDEVFTKFGHDSASKYYTYTA